MYHHYCIFGAHISFFVLTSGRPLPLTTFFVFSKPLCGADRESGIFCTSVYLCKRIFHGSQNLRLLQPSLQQRRSFRKGYEHIFIIISSLILQIDWISGKIWPNNTTVNSLNQGAADNSWSKCIRSSFFPFLISIPHFPKRKIS